ncbi:DUF2141 domain-containing protein [Parvularcula maris]|uniref:DUF2141 domain-containing protein n=1 Tax=Parvularcula maris TaxID=2965077 RepID=A0A9X2RIU9_9PROT|nr:DUF2141 domain-containing protein [Parvularcula maris]MCQ8183978.1 DUF2141 domain-containing protein [Parvularcula maris]
MIKILTATTALAAFAFAPAIAGEWGDKKDKMETASTTVEIEIEGVEEDQGTVYVALQTKDEFAKTDGKYAQTVEADDDEVEVTFEGVEPGEYAVAVFQDTDGDGTLTLDGQMPSEPYAFSGEVEGAPTFEAAAVMVEGEEAEIEIDLEQ